MRFTTPQLRRKAPSSTTPQNKSCQNGIIFHPTLGIFPTKNKGCPTISPSKHSFATPFLGGKTKGRFPCVRSVAPTHNHRLSGHPKETHGDTIAQPVEYTELPAAAARVFFSTKRRPKKTRGTPFNGVFHHEAEKKHKAPGYFFGGGFGTLGSSFFWLVGSLV